MREVVASPCLRAPLQRQPHACPCLLCSVWASCENKRELDAFRWIHFIHHSIMINFNWQSDAIDALHFEIDRQALENQKHTPA